MKLVDFLSEESIRLDLQGQNRDDILRELVDILKLGDRPRQILIDLLGKREKLGSTGIGKGVAIPHCRSLVINRLMMAFGRSGKGVEFDAIDGQPARYFFLIIAPPLEISNLYLPVLGRVAQFCKENSNIERLAGLESPSDFLSLLEEIEIK